MAFAYHCREKCGTEGGVKENFPEIPICGKLRCGKCQEKLNIFRILFIAVDTAFLALLILLEMVFLILSKMLETVLYALRIGFSIADLMLFHTLDVVVLILFQT